MTIAKVGVKPTQEDIELFELVCSDHGSADDVAEYRNEIQKRTYAEVAEWVSEMRMSGETDLRGLLWRLRA